MLKQFLKRVNGLKRPKLHKPGKKTAIALIVCIWITIAGYFLFLILAPMVDYQVKGDIRDEVKGLNTDKPIEMPNSILIPTIKVKEEIFEGDVSALDKGIWHRKPELGDPEIGGNFIITGHRFHMGMTSGDSVENSPLYPIDKLQTGDLIYIVWNKKSYKYEITKIYEVKPTQMEIEDRSDSAKLTLYTCTLGGRWDGRVVVEAMPVE